MAGSLHVYHLHMGGADADALEWRGLFAPPYAQKLSQMGVTPVWSAREADVVVVTGLLTTGNVDAVLVELATMPQPSVVVAAGDAANSGGRWGKARLPGLSRHHLSYYVEVGVAVPGSPPTPQALIAGLVAASELLGG